MGCPHTGSMLPELNEMNSLGMFQSWSANSKRGIKTPKNLELSLKVLLTSRTL